MLQIPAPAAEASAASVAAPPHPPYAAEPAPFDWLRGGLLFLRRNLWLGAACGLLGLLAGLAVVLLSTPQYTATATVVIDARRSHPARPQPASFDFQAESAFVESQVQLLRSPGTLRAVAEERRLWERPDFQSGGGGGGGPLQALRAALGLAEPPQPLPPGLREREVAVRELAERLTVRRVGATSVVEVSVRLPDRAEAAALANAVVAAHVRRQLEGDSAAARRAGAWLEERLADLRRNAVEADRAVQEFKARHGFVDLGPSMLLEQEIAEQTQLLAAARARVAEARSRAQSSEGAAPGDVLRESGPEAIGNAVITRLRGQFLDAQRRESEFAARFGANHGVAVTLRSEMATLERAIGNELARIAEAARADARVADDNLRRSEADFAALVERAGRLNLERSTLRSLQSAADSHRALFESFLARYGQVVQDQTYPLSDAREAAEAVPPFEKSRPRGALLLAAGLMAGLALGLGLAILREALDRRLRAPGALGAALGGTPHVWVAPRAGGRGNPAAAAVSEAAAGARAALARARGRGAAVRVVAVAGFRRGDGASTVAAALVAALAGEEGRRVALLRWDGVPAGDHPPAPPGALALAGPAPLPAESGGPEGLRALRAALAPLLVGAEGEAPYDTVVLDLPPLDGAGLPLLLGGAADALVAVARWGRRDPDEVGEAVRRLGAADLLLLGGVLNRADTKRMRLLAPAAAPPRAGETA